MTKFLRLVKKPRPPVRTTYRVFHGVSISSRNQVMCNAAAELHDRRFLADEAPSLPLDACPTTSNCQCFCEHFDDRRTGLRRDSDDGLPGKVHPDDVRHGIGRRVTDG